MSYLSTLDSISQWGHYEVNGRIYYLLREAYDAASSKEQIQFRFHDNVFKAVNPKREPAQSLGDLYQQRVQQIRAKYDYLVLAYSGGADSHNILQHFELSNTHLDEIVSIEDSSLRGRDSIISGEIFKVAIPGAQAFMEHSPSTKHRIIPVKEYQDKIFFNKDFNFDSYYGIAYQFKPVSMLFQGWWAHFVDDYKHLRDQGKRVGIIWAIDKPRMHYSQTVGYSFSFSDFHSHLGFKNKLIDNPAWEDVPFYWTPELPFIAIKQAHVVAKYLNHCDEIGFYPTHALEQKRNLTARKNGKFISNEYINGIIYPHWDTSTYTYGKERTSLLVSARDPSLASANDPEIIQHSQAIASSFNRYYKEKSVADVITVSDFNTFSDSKEVAGFKHIGATPHLIGIF